MDKITAQTSIKNVISESFSLNPSALITLFEIDLSEIGLNLGIISQIEATTNKNTIFRFHNNVNLTTNSIYWQGKEYIAAPIQAEGFEINAKGIVNKPKLSMTVSDSGIEYLSIFKQRLYEFTNDIVGAKVTRIRTYARFIDAINFIGKSQPQDFSPDPNSELPRDIYYIDRKISENKTTISYELSTLFDLESIKLPGRLVSANSCPFLYRGAGCLYEYADRKNETVHENGRLPLSAPPVANFLNEKFSILLSGSQLVDRGEYNNGEIYSKGEYIYLDHRNIKYYFISKIDNNSNPPPDSEFWYADECSKTILGCKLRFLPIDSGVLQFGGFPSCIRFR